MKKNLLILTIAFISLASFAQKPSLTYSQHALKAGTENVMVLTNYVDPQASIYGEDVVWDFSELTKTQDFKGYLLNAYNSENAAEFSAANTELKEFNNLFYFDVSENGIYEIGSTNTSGSFKIEYTEPSLKMAYPFNVGDFYSGNYAGTYTSGTLSGTITGTYEVSSDAYGTLILPDVTVENAIRVKNVKNYVKNLGSYTSEITIETYRWYAQANTYPALVLSKITSKSNNQTNSSYQAAYKTSVNSLKNDVETLAKINSLEVYPNPVTDLVNVSYELNSTQQVTIKLYDLNGQVVSTLLNEKQEASSYNKTFNLDELGYAKRSLILKVETGAATASEMLIVN